MNYSWGAMAARFAGRVSRKRRSRGIGVGPRYQSKLQIPSNNGASEGRTVNAGTRRGGIALAAPLAESINLIYLPFIRPSVAPPGVDQAGRHLTPEPFEISKSPSAINERSFSRDVQRAFVIKRLLSNDPRPFGREFPNVACRV